jgi:hypothetical protein
MFSLFSSFLKASVAAVPSSLFPKEVRSKHYPAGTLREQCLKNQGLKSLLQTRMTIKINGTDYYF